MLNTKENTMTKYFYRDGSDITKKIFERNGKLVTVRDCDRCEGTGKTYWKWVEGGVCFKCGGIGEYGYERVYTLDHIKKLDKARSKREATRKANWKKENTLVFSGLTFNHNSKKFAQKKFFVDDWKRIQKKSNT